MALTERDHRLLRLSVAVVLGDWKLLAEVRRAAPPGEPDRTWREALLQAHLFAGFPRVVEAAGVLADAGGLGVPEPGEALLEPDRPERGRRLFDQIYADQAAAVASTLRGFHPDLEAWILGHAYGRVLARPGLPPDRRELLAVACLAALGQDRQLASHVRGALRLGASTDELHAALCAVADLLLGPELRRAERVLERFAARDAQRGDCA